jgi:hypothetical protein
MRAHLARKLAIMVLVAVTAFLSGWSTGGVGTGLGLAAVLCTGVALPVFRGGTDTCLPHRRRR